MQNSVKDSFNRLRLYCESNDFSGWDPYDGLNSKVFQSLPFRKWRLARLAWIQGFKRSPLNFRRLLLVPKGRNNKGIALFLSGYCNYYRYVTGSGEDFPGQAEQVLSRIRSLGEWLLESGRPKDGYSGECWGYNFDWESKAFFLPSGTPTIVVTTYVANALLDAWELTKDDRLLQAARRSCNFILSDLNREYDNDGNFIFSYSKFDNSSVFNASLLGSRLLARVFSITGEQKLADEARHSVAAVCSFQKEDGSWTYSKTDFHQWIDNFHTGFNLESVHEYMRFSGDESFRENVVRGYDYYLKTFFTPEGIAKYYNNSVYPIDIHAPSQLVVTAARLGRLRGDSELIGRVLGWTISNMQSPKGYFTFQIHKHYKIKIAYMRWSQAWIFYGLSVYLAGMEGDSK
jgi:hypothetical protein